jgi:NADPH-dependent F420 reductase
MLGRIAIVGGTGDQGFGLALRWAKAGEQIIIGSRQKQKADEAVARLKQILGEEVRVEAMENAEAVAGTNLVVLTVPFAGQMAILKSIKKSLKEGTILVDVTVPLAAEIGGKATHMLGVWQGSAAEQAAEAVPKGVRVVSAFHNVSAGALEDINTDLDCDIIVCGDDMEAKEVVNDLVRKIPGAGYVDGGPLENSRIVESLTALLISINVLYKTHDVGIRITGIPK